MTIQKKIELWYVAFMFAVIFAMAAVILAML